MSRWVKVGSRYIRKSYINDIFIKETEYQDGPSWVTYVNDKWADSCPTQWEAEKAVEEVVTAY